MFTPTDPQLREIIDNAADDLIAEVDMVLDEGSWIPNLYRRIDALGISHTQDIARMREVAEEIIALRVARHLLERLVVDMESEPQLPPDKVFVQGSGWIERWKEKGDTL